MKTKIRTARLKGKKHLKSNRGAALAEYVFLLVAIGLAGVIAVFTLGDEVRDLYDDVGDTLSDTGPDGNPWTDGPGGPGGGGTGGSGGGGGDGGSPGDGPGEVGPDDKKGGCPLAISSRFFPDTGTVHFPYWSFVNLNATPESPPLKGDRGGPFFKEGHGIRINTPSNAIVDVYSDRSERYIFTNLWYFNYVDRAIFTMDNTSTMRDNCPDGRDGAPPPPPDHGDGGGNGYGNGGAATGSGTSFSGAAPGSFASASDGDSQFAKGHFEHADDIDRFNLTLAEGGTLGLRADEENFHNRYALQYIVTLKDQAGNSIRSTTISRRGSMVVDGLAPGNYIVDVQNTYPDKGGYKITAEIWQDIPNTFEEAEPYVIGDAYRSEITEGDLGDMFVFEVSEPSSVGITAKQDSTNGLKYPAIEVYDKDQNLIDAKSGDSDTSSVMTPVLDTGTYYVRVKGKYDFYYGRYILSSETAYDIPHSYSDAVDMPLDTSIESDVAPGDRGDMFRVKTNASSDINFRVLGTGDNRIKRLDIEVYDGNKVLLADDKTASYGVVAAVMLNDAPADTYYLRVKGYSDDAEDVGDYTAIADSSHDIHHEFSKAQTLPLNTPFVSDVVPADVGDTFKVTTNAQGVLSLQAVGSGSDDINRLQIEVFDSSGTSLGSDNTSSRKDVVAVQLNDAPVGVYYVRIGGLLNGDAGEYTVTADLVDDIPHQFSKAKEVNVDAYEYSDIAEGDPGDMFRFATGSESDLNFRVVGTGSGSLRRIDMNVYDANQNHLGGVKTSSNKATAGVLLNDMPAGVYYLHVNGYFSSDVGDYEIILDTSDDIPNETAKAQAINTDSTFTSDVAYGDRGDMLKITTSETKDVSFQAVGTGSSSLRRVDLNVYDSSGNHLGQNKTSSNGTIAAVMINDLPAGTYYLNVDGYFDSDVGDYRVFVDTSDDISHETAKAQPITADIPFDSDLTEGDPGDMLKVNIDSLKSQVSFTAAGTGSPRVSRFNFTVYDSSGNSLGNSLTSSSSQTATVTLTDVAPGDYYLLIKGRFTTDTGHYRAKVTTTP